MSACGPKKETDAQDSGSRNDENRDELNEVEGKESQNNMSVNTGYSYNEYQKKHFDTIL